MSEKPGLVSGPDLNRLARTIFMVGAVMLLVGLFFFSLDDRQTLYQPQNVVVLTLRIGGLLLMGTAIICRLGNPLGVLLDTLISGIVGLVLIVAGLLWWSQQGWLALMIVLFGILSLNSAWGSWRDYRRLQNPVPLPADYEIHNNHADESAEKENNTGPSTSESEHPSSQDRQ